MRENKHPFDISSMSFQIVFHCVQLYTWSSCKSCHRCFGALWTLIPSDCNPAHIPRWAGLPGDHHRLADDWLLGLYGVDGTSGVTGWLREVGLVWDVWLLAHMGMAGGCWRCSVGYDQWYVDVRSIWPHGFCWSSSVRHRHWSLLPNRQSCERK